MTWFVSSRCIRHSVEHSRQRLHPNVINMGSLGGNSHRWRTVTIWIAVIIWKYELQNSTLLKAGGSLGYYQMPRLVLLLLDICLCCQKRYLSSEVQAKNTHGVSVVQLRINSIVARAEVLMILIWGSLEQGAYKCNQGWEEPSKHTQSKKLGFKGRKHKNWTKTRFIIWSNKKSKSY